LRKCECGGLVPAGSPSCPNCDLAVKSGQRMRKVLAIVALAASSCGPPLMAAYGVPPCADGGFSCYEPPVTDGGTADGGTRDGGP